MNEVMSISLPLEDIRNYCSQQPILRLSLFGSAMRGDSTAESDIDLLVEYVPGARIGLLAMSSQQIELSQIIGRHVDLRTPQDLSRYFRQEVVNNAWLIYE